MRTGPLYSQTTTKASSWVTTSAKSEQVIHRSHKYWLFDCIKGICISPANIHQHISAIPVSGRRLILCAILCYNSFATVAPLQQLHSHNSTTAFSDHRTTWRQLNDPMCEATCTTYTTCGHKGQRITKWYKSDTTKASECSGFNDSPDETVDDKCPVCKIKEKRESEVKEAKDKHWGENLLRDMCRVWSTSKTTTKRGKRGSVKATQLSCSGRLHYGRTTEMMFQSLQISL